MGNLDFVLKLTGIVNDGIGKSLDLLGIYLTALSVNSLDFMELGEVDCPHPFRINFHHIFESKS